MSNILANAAAVSALTLSACSQPPAFTFYVVSPSSASTSQFQNDLAALLREHGLTPSLGRTTDENGHTFYVLDASRLDMRVWSQNVYLTGRENPALCGHHDEDYPDPHQFVVDVWPGVIAPLSAPKERQMDSELRAELNAKGYIVSPKPVLCSASLRPSQ